jgi:ribosomal protein L35AE/L33A
MSNPMLSVQGNPKKYWRGWNKKDHDLPEKQKNKVLSPNEAQLNGNVVYVCKVEKGFNKKCGFRTGLRKIIRGHVLRVHGGVAPLREYYEVVL